MKYKELIKGLDCVLGPLGFYGKKSVWNKRVGNFVLVVDLQLSKDKDFVTLNAGVVDAEAYAKVWGQSLPDFVDQPVCTVQARIGDLIDGRDIWWQLGNSGIACEINNSVTERVVPFLDRMCSRVEMVRWLSDTGVVSKRYPPPILSLAIMLIELGRPEGAELLVEVGKKALGGWRKRAAEVAERMGVV